MNQIRFLIKSNFMNFIECIKCADKKDKYKNYTFIKVFLKSN